VVFQKFVAARKQSCFDLGQIGNMDELPLTFKVPLNSIVDTKGAKSITKLLAMRKHIALKF
jgi:hypothetical protein